MVFAWFLGLWGLSWGLLAASGAALGALLGACGLSGAVPAGLGVGWTVLVAPRVALGAGRKPPGLAEIM